MNEMANTGGEVVVVTGASAGVGRATAVAYARRGARVALLARDQDGLDGALAEVQAAGGSGLAIPTDVADAGQVEAAADRVEEALGPIAIWINNAMATVFAPVTRIAPAELRRATEVTFLGSAYGTMAALRRMTPRNRGTIVQIGSALGYRSIPLQAPYCAAKHAIRGFTDALRCELLHDNSGIRLTMINLPAVNTPQFEWALSRMPRHPQPLPPIFSPEFAARAIVWGAAAGRREVHVGLPTVLAIVANKLFPHLLDRHLARIGYDEQQTDEPVDADRPANLFQPVTGLHRSAGRFAEGSQDASAQFWATVHRSELLIGAGAMAAACGLAFLLGRNGRRSKR